MKRTLILLLLLTLAGRLVALSWTPSLEAGGGLVLAYNLSLEDEVLEERTAAVAAAELRPLALCIADRHTLSLGARALAISDSINWNSTVLLGSARLTLFTEYEVRLASFILSVDAGLGYGALLKQDVGFATLEAGIGAGLVITPFLAVRMHAGLVYRREFLDLIIRFGVRTTLPQSVWTKGGGK